MTDAPRDARDFESDVSFASALVDTAQLPLSRLQQLSAGSGPLAQALRRLTAEALGEAGPEIAFFDNAT